MGFICQYLLKTEKFKNIYCHLKPTLKTQLQVSNC